MINSEEISQVKEDTTVTYSTFQALGVAHDGGGQDGRHLDMAGQGGGVKHCPKDVAGEGGEGLVQSRKQRVFFYNNK